MKLFFFCTGHVLKECLSEEKNMHRFKTNSSLVLLCIYKKKKKGQWDPSILSCWMAELSCSHVHAVFLGIKINPLDNNFYYGTRFVTNILGFRNNIIYVYSIYYTHSAGVNFLPRVKDLLAVLPHPLVGIRVSRAR